MDYDDLNDPYLDAGMRNFLAATARANLWRFKGWEYADLLQELYAVFLHCHRRYVGQRPKKKRDGTRRRSLPRRRPDKVAVKHFMAIVKTAVHNHMATLSLKRTREVPLVLVCDLIPEDQHPDAFWEQTQLIEQESASIASLIINAPREIRQVLDLLIWDAVELGRYHRQRIGDYVIRETSNDRYCRALGLPFGTDVVGMFERYFIR